MNIPRQDKVNMHLQSVFLGRKKQHFCVPARLGLFESFDRTLQDAPRAPSLLVAQIHPSSPSRIYTTTLLLPLYGLSETKNVPGAFWKVGDLFGFHLGKTPLDLQTYLFFSC